jgi:hypothetical protein
MAATDALYYDDYVDTAARRRAETVSRASRVAPAILGLGAAAATIAVFIVYASRKKKNDDDTSNRIREQANGLDSSVKTRASMNLSTKKLIITSRAAAGAGSDTPGAGGDTTTKHPLPDTPEVEQLVKQLCPAPYEIYSIDLSGSKNCYKKCAPSFESVAYNPRSEDEVFTTHDYDVQPGGKTSPPSGTTTPDGGNTTIIKLQSARVCRATCAPRKDYSGKVTPGVEIMEKSACERRFTRREMGYGPSVVKCDWVVNIGDGRNYLEGCGAIFHADYPGYSGGGTENPDCEYGRQNTTFDGDQNKDWCTMHSGRAAIKMTPIACGLDYELLPANKAAYFTHNMYGGAAGSAGAVHMDDPIGMRCFKRCPAFSTQIPWGSIPSGQDGRSHYCAEPCPRNTRENPANVNACIKDGYNQEIVLEDLGQEIAKILEAKRRADGEGGAGSGTT